MVRRPQRGAKFLSNRPSSNTGVGKSKSRFLELELGREALEAMWAIKNAMDPNGILNPGHTLPNLDEKK